MRTKQKVKHEALIVMELARFSYNLTAAILLPNGKLSRNMDQLEATLHDDISLGIENEYNDVFDAEFDSTDPCIDEGDEEQKNSSADAAVYEEEVYEYHSELARFTRTQDRQAQSRQPYVGTLDSDSDEDAYLAPIQDGVDGTTSTQLNKVKGVPFDATCLDTPSSQVERITLRRHHTTGFGFRPADGVTVQPIVASVIKNSSAARHGLKVGDRIHSIITPKIPLQAQDRAVMLVDFLNGPQTLYQVDSVDQIKQILGQCSNYVTLCVIRDMEQLDTDIEVEMHTQLGLGLQTTDLGIFVTSVQPGSVGDAFGYRFGDQILSINNHVVRTSDDIRRIRRSCLREEESRRTKKRSSLFRSISSLSTTERTHMERIKLSVGRRSVDDFSTHPISEIWNETESHTSPTNILQPMFHEKETVPASAPPDVSVCPHVWPPPFEETASLNNFDLSESDHQETQPSTSSPTKPETLNEPFLLESSNSQAGLEIPIEKTRKTSEKDSKCVICLEDEKEIVFQPCWHQITCSECAVRLRECPLCREVIAVRRRPYRC